ncbi:MAG TPA: PQQ-binding-like beta-propeller repeat protein [Planctomycetota bacterium]|nr:PQQ-binding-like beta-propeller repeat protein [Planctomycetota bacterium]
MTLRMLLSGLVFAAVCPRVMGAQEAVPSAWAGWRGPRGDGHSLEKGLPVRWTEESVVWKTPLRGWGQSSPVIWGDRIFLTTALDRGRQRLVFSVNRRTGALEWEKVAWTGEPEPTHEMNGWASATCAADAERVYAFFGKGGGLLCYRHDGTPLWSRELGAFEGPWGTAACPIVVGDLVIQNCDADKSARLVAFDRKTGKELWSTPRSPNRGWSTPVLIEASGRQELVLNGHTGTIAYDPGTGRELWSCSCPQGRGEPTVTPAQGLLYVANGLPGGGLYSIRPGGSGDVTASHRLWLSTRGGRDTPSPIVIGQTVLLVSLRPDVLTAYDAASGQELWKERVGGQISASPVSYDGLAFFVNEAGETIVVDPRSPEKIVGRNTVGASKGELFRATLTPLGGQLFIRSDKFLYCVGKPPAK